MDTDPWNEAGYDPSLAYLLWAWGCADGFSNGKGSLHGSYAHRRGSIPFLLEQIAKGDPWKPDPTSGRAPVDWLWEMDRLAPQDFRAVLEACLTHHCAPDPSTWSLRPLYSASHAEQQPAQTWINGIVRNARGPDVAGLYVSLGGRLDSPDRFGRGLLANASQLEWSQIERFMAAAETQGASLLSAPANDSWVTTWNHHSSSELAAHQATLAKLSQKYPAACRSQINPVDEMLSFIRQASGMRPTSAAWKRLEMDRYLRAHPEDLLRMQGAVLSLALRLSSIRSLDTQDSTFFYLAGRLAKLCDPVKDSRLLPGCRLAAALSTKNNTYADAYLLLACSQSATPDPSVSMSDWASAQRVFFEQCLVPSAGQNKSEPSASSVEFVSTLLDVLDSGKEVLPPDRLRALLVELQAPAPPLSEAPGQVRAGPGHVSGLLALDARANPDMTSSIKIMQQAVRVLESPALGGMVLTQDLMGVINGAGPFLRKNERAAARFIELFPVALKASDDFRNQANRLLTTLASDTAPSSARRTLSTYLAKHALSQVAEDQGQVQEKPRPKM